MLLLQHTQQRLSSAGRSTTSGSGTKCVLARPAAPHAAHTSTKRSRTTCSSSVRRSRQLADDAARRRATVKLPNLLTNQIAVATSLSQLHDVLAEHGSRLNHIHVAKLLTRTSQLAAAAAAAAAETTLPATQQQQHGDIQPQHQQQHVQLLYSRLLEMMAQRARHATADTLVAAVAAVGRIANLLASSSSSAAAAGDGNGSSAAGVVAASKQHLQPLAGRAEELLPELTSISQLSALLWGFAKAGLHPSRSWLDAMLRAALSAYELAYKQQQQQQQQHQDETNNSTSSPAAAHAAPPTPGLLPRPLLPPAATNKQQQQQQQPRRQQPVSLQQQHQQQQHQQNWRKRPQQHSLATDLALILYSVSQMAQQPQQQLVAELQTAFLQQLPAANPQDMSQVLWGLAALGQNPGGQQWLDKVLLAFADKGLEGCGSQALANSIWALQRLTQPEERQQQPQQVSTQPEERQQQRLVLPAAWQQAFLDALCTEPTLPSNPQALSCCLSSLARLKWSLPDPTRVLGVLDQGIDALPAFTPRQLTDTLWACAGLGLQPNAPWLKSFLQTAARAADAGRFSSAQQLGMLVWSLAVVKPPGQALLMSQQLQLQVLLQALAAAHQGRGLRVLGPAGRSGLAWALASLGVTLDRSFLTSLLNAAFADNLASDQVRCASTLFCIASLDFEHLVDYLGEFLEGQHQEAEGGGLDLSLQKYGALVGVLGALSEMDSRQLRAAWLDQTLTADWSVDAASEGMLQGAMMMQLPPALASWVDSLAATTTESSSTPGRGVGVGAQSP